MWRSMSNSLWWVINGFAVAPPGIMFIIGVSTCVKAFFMTIHFLLGQFGFVQKKTSTISQRKGRAPHPSITIAGGGDSQPGWGPPQ